jgi:uncharacterized protein
MSELKEHKPGTFCWAELATTNGAGAAKFYGDLMGWAVVENPMGPGEPYRIFQYEGLDTAACCGLMPDQVANGVPPHWTLYVSVESADGAVKKAVELGGAVLAGPFDVMEHGRMAVLKDPQGAVFAVWQPKSHIGSRNGYVNGRHCWSELATTDAKAAVDFYTNLFGWGAHVAPVGGMDYTTWMANGTPAGGLMQMDETWGGAPPHWMVYFSVPNVSQFAEETVKAGGKICVPPKQVAGVGTFSVLNDPQGAFFSVIELTQAA